MSNKSNGRRVRESGLHRLAMLLYAGVGMALMIQGIRYLAGNTLMPYHLAVIDTAWEGLDRSNQTLFLGLLKGFGAGALCAGLAILLLALIPLRDGSGWALWMTPAVAATYTGALVYVTRFALLPGATPIIVTTVLLALVAVAAACSLIATINARR